MNDINWKNIMWVSLFGLLSIVLLAFYMITNGHNEPYIGDTFQNTILALTLIFSAGLLISTVKLPEEKI